MTESFSLRPVALSDSSLISEMIAQAFAAAGESGDYRPSWTAQSVAGITIMPGFVGVLAFGESEPLGFLLCRIAADEAEILSLGVAPSARRSGIARAMLEQFIVQAQGQGVIRIFLEVASRNKGAQAFYRTFGFKGIGRRRDYYSIDGDRFDDALIWARELKHQ